MNNNELEIMKNCIENYKTFLHLQRELLNEEKFFCTECHEIHSFDERVGIKNICKPCHQKAMKQRMRELRARRKAEKEGTL